MSREWEKNMVAVADYGPEFVFYYNASTSLGPSGPSGSPAFQMSTGEFNTGVGNGSIRVGEGVTVDYGYERVTLTPKPGYKGVAIESHKAPNGKVDSVSIGGVRPGATWTYDPKNPLRQDP